MRILYQFPLSHFCEKARWLLDYKELDYVAQNLIPGWHQAFARLKTGQSHLPILKDQQQWIANSTPIAEYLDLHYPEHLLLGTSTLLRSQILAIDTQCNALGVLIHQWLLSDAWQQDQAMDIALGETGYLRKFSRYSKPLFKTILSKGFDLNAERKQHLKQHIQAAILQLNEHYTAAAGFMVGQRLSLADIAVCSMLAPLLNIEATPWELEEGSTLDPETALLKQFILALPLGQYVVQAYAQHRHARVDWRGI